MLKMEEIKQLPLEELKIRLRDAEEELINLRFQLALHQLENPLKVRYLRKDIAGMIIEFIEKKVASLDLDKSASRTRTRGKG